MSHCHSTIFHGDNFCPDCGETLTTTPQKYSVEEVFPTILDDVRKYYTEAEAKTGRVLESRLYKRLSKTSSQNLEYSYWWLRLETNDGTIIETSISAEHKYTSSIGRGDILTLYYPTTMNLLYKKSRDAKKFVKDNQSVPCVVVHGDKGQCYTVENLYPKPEKKSPWLWIVAGVLAAILMFNASHTTTGSVWLTSLVVAIVVLLLENNRNKKKFAFEEAKDEALNASFKKLLKVTKEQLGYSNIERNKKSSDIICIQCNARLPEDIGYCTCCGNANTTKYPPDTSLQNVNSKFNQMNPTPPTLEATGLYQENDAQELSKVHSSPSSVSVSDIQQRLHEVYSYHSLDNYTHHYALKDARQGKLSNEFILARVSSLSLKADVSDVTHQTTTTTETKHYRGNNYQYSTYDTQSSSHRNRSSTLKGKVLLEYVSGKTVTFTLSEDVLGDIDVDDWIAIADSYVEFEDQSKYYFEYAYNITKDKEYFDSSFANYSDIRGGNIWWSWNILFVVGGITAAFTNNDALVPLCFTGIVLFNFYALCKSLTSSGKNKHQRKALLKPLQERVSVFKESLEPLKKQLNVIG